MQTLHSMKFHAGSREELLEEFANGFPFNKITKKQSILIVQPYSFDRSFIFFPEDPKRL